MNFVTVEDIQPGAEFYEVFAPFGREPELMKETIVCNGEPFRGTWSSEKDLVDVSVGPNHWSIKLAIAQDMEKRRDIRSLYDLHIFKTNKVYNHTRWFHTKEEAEEWIDMIKFAQNVPGLVTGPSV